jgi:hypothetical protein
MATTARGVQPAAWSSTDGSSWTPGIFTPPLPAGSTTKVEGCLSTGNGFIAYGETGNTLVEQPAVWNSSDGINWQLASASFTGLSNGPLGDQAAPLDGIGTGTSTLLGWSGQGDLPWQLWPALVGGAAGAEPTLAGLWSSVNAGTSWQQMDTDVAPFTGSLFAQADAVTFENQQPVVAGIVDGRLTVWVGTPVVVPGGPATTGTPATTGPATTGAGTSTTPKATTTLFTTASRCCRPPPNGAGRTGKRRTAGRLLSLARSVGSGRLSASPP